MLKDCSNIFLLYYILQYSKNFGVEIIRKKIFKVKFDFFCINLWHYVLYRIISIILVFDMKRELDFLMSVYLFSYKSFLQMLYQIKLSRSNAYLNINGWRKSCIEVLFRSVKQKNERNWESVQLSTWSQLSSFLVSYFPCFRYS